MVKVKKGGKWITVKPGQTIGKVSNPAKKVSVKPGKGVYYNIDDPNKTPEVRSGSGFAKVTEPIVNRGGGSSNRSPTPSNIAKPTATQKAAVSNVTEKIPSNANQRTIQLSQAQMAAVKKAAENSRQNYYGQGTREDYGLSYFKYTPKVPKRESYITSNTSNKRYSRSFKESGKEFIKTTGRDIKKIGKNVFLGRDKERLENPFKEFELSGIMIGEKEIRTPEFGTKTTESGYTSRTLFDIQREAQLKSGVPINAIGLSPQAQSVAIGQELSKDIFKEYQEKVNIGELEVDEAQKLAQNKLEQQYAERTKNIFSNAEDLTKTTGQTVSRVGTQVAITSAIVGGSVFLAPATFTASSTLLGITAEAKGEKELAQAFLGAGVISSITAPTAIATSIDRGRLLELEQQNFKITGISAANKKESLTLIKGTRYTDFASQDVRVTIPAFNTGAGAKEGVIKFSAVGGKGKSITNLVSFKESIQTGTPGAILRFKEDFTLTARGLSGLPSFSRAAPSDLISLRDPRENELGSLGRLDIVIGDKVTRTSFGGTGTTGRISYVSSGTPSFIFKKTSGVLFGSSASGEIITASPKEILRGFGKASKTRKEGINSVIKSLQSDKGVSTIKLSKRASSLKLAGSQAGIKTVETIKLPTLQTINPTITASLTSTTITKTKKQKKQSFDIGSIQKLNNKPIQSTISIKEQAMESPLLSITKSGTTTIRKSKNRQADITALVPMTAQIPIKKQKKITGTITTPFFPKVTPRLPPPKISPPEEIPFRFILPKTKQQSGKKSSFTILGRRFGKFKVVGTARTPRQAIFKGRQWASGSLGATFKVPGVKAVSLPNFTTKKKKGEVFYVEKVGKRLKKGGGEIPEIQFFKQLKGGKK